jgi:hypothetical protein
VGDGGTKAGAAVGVYVGGGVGLASNCVHDVRSKPAMTRHRIL